MSGRPMTAAERAEARERATSARRHVRVLRRSQMAFVPDIERVIVAATVLPDDLANALDALDAAEATLARVRALHQTQHRQTRALHVDGVTVGGGVQRFCSCGRTELMPGGGYDCPTRAALDATEQP